MKLTILHETTTVGAIAIRPAGLNNSGDSEIYRPRGIRRWYLEFSNEVPTYGLMETDGEGSLSKTKTQFGDQTSQPKKLVWQPLGEKHSEDVERWYLGNPKRAKPPRQSSPKFPPPHRDYSDFIMGSGR